MYKPSIIISVNVDNTVFDRSLITDYQNKDYEILTDVVINSVEKVIPLWNTIKVIWLEHYHPLLFRANITTITNNPVSLITEPHSLFRLSKGRHK